VSFQGTSRPVPANGSPVAPRIGFFNISADNLSTSINVF